MKLSNSIFISIAILICFMIIADTVTAEKVNLERKKHHSRFSKNKHASKHRTKVRGFFEWLEREWSDADLNVKDLKTGNTWSAQKTKFKLVCQNYRKNRCLGLEFQDTDLETQSNGKSNADKTGFVQNVIQMASTVESKGKQWPYVDFRLVKNCDFGTNADDWLFTAWKLKFRVTGTEGHSLGSRQNGPWDVEVKLTWGNAEVSHGLNIQDATTEFKKLCGVRNKEIDTLKAEAKALGNEYQTLLQELYNRELKLQKQQSKQQTHEQKLVTFQVQLKTDKDAADAQLKKESAKLQSLKEAVGKLNEEAGKSSSDLTEQQRLIKEAQDKLNDLDSEKNDLQAHLDDLENKLAAHIKANEALKKKKEGHESDLQKHSAEMEKLKNEQEETIKAQIAELKKLQSSLAESSSDVKKHQTDFDSLSDKMKASLDSFNQKLEEIVKFADGTRPRTKSALLNVEHNKHAPEINAIVSNKV